ncbi:MAG: methylated-DNA--[protein]-cysteine S-methyltransferase [Fusobacteriaceae bacterium]
MNKYLAYLDTPIGILELRGDDDYLISALFLEKRTETERTNPLMEEAVRQFALYFEGKLDSFNLPIQLNGTEFQNKAWKELCNIPYGETISYKEQAIRIGNPKGCRAVGGANGKNILNIVVPCHRVIGSNNTLTGYGGGLDKKQWLLEHEKRNLT